MSPPTKRAFLLPRNYLRQGGDIVRLSMVQGHTQITTTKRYLHLLTEDLSASHQKVSILKRLGSGASLAGRSHVLRPFRTTSSNEVPDG